MSGSRTEQRTIRVSEENFRLTSRRQSRLYPDPRHGSLQAYDLISVPGMAHPEGNRFTSAPAAVHREEGGEQGLGPDHTDSSRSILWIRSCKTTETSQHRHYHNINATTTRTAENDLTRQNSRNTKNIMVNAYPSNMATLVT